MEFGKVEEQAAEAYHNWTTRDLSTASGTQVVTGVGFQPKSILFTSCQAGGAGGIYWTQGHATETGFTMSMMNRRAGVTGDFIQSGTSVMVILITAGNQQSADLTSFDADGFTLTWGKTGTPTGTARFSFLCLR